MVQLTEAYCILVFYGLLSIVGATIGNHYDEKRGFTKGYVLGTILSVLLWYTIGHKAADANL